MLTIAFMGLGVGVCLYFRDLRRQETWQIRLQQHQAAERRQQIELIKTALREWAQEENQEL